MFVVCSVLAPSFYVEKYHNPVSEHKTLLLLFRRDMQLQKTRIASWTSCSPNSLLCSQEIAITHAKALIESESSWLANLFAFFYSTAVIKKVQHVVIDDGGDILL